MRETTTAWLYLALTPGLGPIRSLRLIQQLGSVHHVMTASISILSSFVGQKLAHAIHFKQAEQKVNTALRWAEHAHCHLITLDDVDYPIQLAEMNTPPIVLFARGRRELLSQPMLAMVGSRQATRQGQHTAHAFAAELAAQGYTIVSGLARGIDAACHAGALNHPASTLAVIGNGIDRVYPSCHHALSDQLANAGLILSEFTLGTPPLAAHFPQRNRIIAGLAKGCLIIEASLRSGSLITARYALEAGRSVMAIPGSIHNPEARGCHHLIKQGARLVETLDDILEEVGPAIMHVGPPRASTKNTDTLSSKKDLCPRLESLLTILGTEAITAESLAMQLSLTLGDIYAMLLELELEGYVASLPGGRFQRLMR